VENIERNQFVVLTGHLDEQPLPELIRRLRVQRKSGRLQVEYPDGPGSFFFEDGQLVDAHLGALRGVEALYAALSLDGASFNFNPLVRPPERNIDRQGQKFIHDLVEAPRRKGLAEIKVAGGESDTLAATHSLPQHAPRQLPPAAELMAPLEERLTAVEEAIISTSHRFSRERLIYAVIIGFLAGLSLITTLNVIFGPSRSRSASATGAALSGPGHDAANGAVGQDARASSEAAVNKGQQEVAVGAEQERGGFSKASNSNEHAEPTAEQSQSLVPSTAAVIGTRKAGGLSAARREYVVQVLVEVKNGRVTDARVWNPRPGADAYESVALKMAKERRYPDTFSGGERLRIRVKP
jgi:ABC-type dipeptide/oligopeptide/nickel transport system ATPase subunit